MYFYLYLDGVFRYDFVVFDIPFDQTLEVIVNIFEDDVLDEFALFIF